MMLRLPPPCPPLPIYSEAEFARLRVAYEVEMDAYNREGLRMIVGDAIVVGVSLLGWAIFLCWNYAA